VAEVRDSVARTVVSSGATLIVIEHRVAVWSDLVTRVIVLDAAGGILADGAPDDVLAREGERLASAGVWVPGHPPAVSWRTTARPAAPLLVGSQLAVGRERGVAVSSGIEATVESGRALAITGPNGAGKTTLALTLAGLLPAISGTVRATGILADGIGPTPIEWRSRQLLTRIGTVFQDPEHQFLTASVRAELEVGPRTARMPGPAAIADELLQRLRLDHLADANPFTLSGGEKRRLSVATILATQPRVLVLDEPTFGQDSRTWSELLALLVELLDDGRAIVAVSHDLEFVDALADRELELGR
jgi:energy-coupling factor transport system ATP-binding protein